jgi:hypothetical protein
MDVERTIEFILKSQANAERRMDRFDKRLEGIARLIQQGMRMLSSNAEAQKRADLRLAVYQKRTDLRFAELSRAQKRTDSALAELAQAQKETQRP